jgi:hypothetical protein
MPADAGHLALIGRLAAVRPPAFVFGGYAEDALLAGRTTRPHGDVDVLVGRTDLAAHLRRFDDWGFSSFEIVFEVVPGSPLVYRATKDGVEVELGIFDEVLSGRPSFVLPLDDRVTRVTLPRDSLTHPLGSIDGVAIRTISPLALYQMRAALTLTGAFGPPRPKDETAHGQLRADLLASTPADELEPEFGPYPP